MLLALRAAFAFLTVLTPGKIFSNSCMKNSTFFYPVVGIVLGLILVSTSILVLRLSYSPPLASAAYIILSFFLTRGLHHDGLADIADAWGSGTRGTKFREILKDSRIGSFGTIVLILYFLLCHIAITSILSENSIKDFIACPIGNIFFTTFRIHSDTIFLLFLAPIWGRIGLLMQPAFDMPYIPSFNNKELGTKTSHVPNSTLLNNSLETQSNTVSKTVTQNPSDKSSNPRMDDSNFTAPTSLSQIMIHRFQKIRFFLWFSVFIILFLFFMSPIHLLFTLGTSFFVFAAFYLLSKRENGYNGDFLGAQCLCFETVIFLNIYV